MAPGAAEPVPLSGHRAQRPDQARQAAADLPELAGEDREVPVRSRCRPAAGPRPRELDPRDARVCAQQKQHIVRQPRGGTPVQARHRNTRTGTRQKQMAPPVTSTPAYATQSLLATPHAPDPPFGVPLAGARRAISPGPSWAICACTRRGGAAGGRSFAARRRRSTPGPRRITGCRLGSTAAGRPAARSRTGTRRTEHAKAVALHEGMAGPEGQSPGQGGLPAVGAADDHHALHVNCAGLIGCMPCPAGDHGRSRVRVPRLDR